MRIAVMAAGAVGGYFGARMAAAGHDVAFIARGAHRDAIRREGLKIESSLGDLHLKDVNVTDDPKQVGPVDLVLFAVKLWDTEAAGEQTRPLVGSNTRVVTLQNGVDSVERLAPILGNDVTIGGATYVVSTITKPGEIRHTGATAKVRCGRLDRRPDAQLAGYVEQMKAATSTLRWPMICFSTPGRNSCCSRAPPASRPARASPSASYATMTTCGLSSTG
jgi:2-dehydropantoate 2-reductase